MSHPQAQHRPRQGTLRECSLWPFELSPLTASIFYKKYQHVTSTDNRAYSYTEPAEQKTVQCKWASFVHTYVSMLLPGIRIHKHRIIIVSTVVKWHFCHICAACTEPKTSTALMESAPTSLLTTVTDLYRLSVVSVYVHTNDRFTELWIGRLDNVIVQMFLDIIHNIICIKEIEINWN